jgi:dTDP-4-dehydrorhamnose reductase
MKKRLLVTGASGFLGWNICHFAGRTWEMLGTVLSHRVKIPDVKVTRADLRNFKELKGIFQRFMPSAVIHTASASDPNFCQINRTESREINVDTAVHLADLCAEYKVPYVFTSTDLVFDGLRAPYKETDPVNPVNIYGEQKALAESSVLKSYPPAAICRMPLMFGHAGPVATSFIQPMVKAMNEGKDLKLFTDEFRTPVSAQTAVSGLFLALEKVSGLIHLGGLERISRYDFARLMIEVFGFRNARIIPCKQKDIKMAAPRPPDVSLDSSKAFALGYRPLPLEVGLKEMNLWDKR